MTLKTLVKKFVDKLENKGKLDDKLFDQILEASENPDKQFIMQHMVEQIEVFRSYDEDPDDVNFNYEQYLEELDKKEK